MEFFSNATIPATAADLQSRLTIKDLPQWCTLIEKVLSDSISSGEIYSVWGVFRINREELHGGVRFSLPSCANVLQWTVTSGLPPDPLQTVIHATINRTEQDQDFVDSLQQFVDAWKVGLESYW